MPLYKGSCHCGTVKFEIDTEITELTTCNCSLCAKKNALMARVHEEEFKITQGEDNLSLYQWNFKIAKHYFCKTCGIYPFHAKRSEPDHFGINVRCLEGFDVDTVAVNHVVSGRDMSIVGEGG